MARLGISAAAAALVLAAPAGAETVRHTARPLVVHRPVAEPLAVAVAPGVAFVTPFAVLAGAPGRLVRVPHYIGPDGTYDGYADLVRSVNGTPCGQGCTRRSLQRWGYAPAE